MSDRDAALESGTLVDQINREVHAIAARLGCENTTDLFFLSFLRRMARFGYFTLGPITIDVRLIEDLVERNAVPGPVAAASEDFVRFSRLLMQEVRRSERTQIDELHLLLALMRWGEGLPGRVFGELGVTPEQIERYLQQPHGAAGSLEQLMTPEEVADYLQVHVQTVRAWIRAGTLPARRVAGLRALRVRAGDVERMLKPLGPPG